MARPSVSYQKRRKEIARLEKRREKEAKREERKMEKDQGETSGPPIEVVDPADLGLPELEYIRSEDNRLPENIRKRFDPTVEEEPQP